MENKEPIVNFSSTNSSLEYFKHAPLSEWGFEFYKNHYIKTIRGKPRLKHIYSKYRLCLDNLPHIKELSADKKLAIDNLIKKLVSHTIFSLKKSEEQQSETSTNYYNYNYGIGSIGLQGNVYLVPRKKTLEGLDSLEEVAAEEETRKSTPVSSEYLSQSEPKSDLTETTDESYNEPRPLSRYGELLKQRKYVLVFLFSVKAQTLWVIK
ncbi:uncharacterized protein EV154DRAFT_569301 [Mucor mucedo]|uniref:uncharacterized protein n=1 Tax=Mucor mucedo TaxID=29922 RepID=UPI00221E4D11|nr:uncharacterized protein EV154DRAFT_569301 [Mucor mucedo]KAI7876149.1 hypothetical protein EV154DRAFT_569301 [Mucor mucedo]